MPTAELSDRDLVAIIQAHRSDSLGVEDGELSIERADALDRYHGRPYGTEMEGRSSVVSKDLSEAVDWAMPAIMRIFTQSGAVAEFDPVGPEDEQLAEIETDYCNQVVMKDNPGWLILHDAIKDTLLLKNGYVKHWWDESEEVKKENYQGLSVPQVQQLLMELSQKGEVEILGQEEKMLETPQGPMPVFDLQLQIRNKVGKVRIEAVPCEEIRVSRRCRGTLQDSPFVEHVTRKTRSDLIEMGMDQDFVAELAAYEGDVTGTQRISRDSVSDESTSNGATSIDRSMDEIEFCEAYIRVDWDGDGIAELRRVVTCDNQIPPGDEWNREIEAVAITGFTAKRVPHRHVGESLYDDLGDLAEIKTVLMRQILDNVYATNNNQWLVNERVNLGDFMTSLPGGIKRIEGIEPIAGAVEPIVTQSIIAQILPVVDYIDATKEARTGINRATTGLDPDILKQSTKGAFMENLNRASQKVEMITRMLAETGIKEMVLQVHGLLIRHQDKARMIRMKGRFIDVNPSEWKERTDLTVKVGLGTGNEEDRQRKLMMIAQLQQQLLAPIGLVGPGQAYSLFSDVAKTMGFDMPEKYGLSPESPEFAQKMQQPPPPNPLVQVEQVKSQARMQEAQLDMQLEQQKAQANIQQEQVRSANDMTIEREKIAAEMQLERYKAELKSETDYKIALLNAQLKEQEQMNGLRMHEIQTSMSAQAAPVEVGENPDSAVIAQLQQQLATISTQLQMMAAAPAQGGREVIVVNAGGKGEHKVRNGRAVKQPDGSWVMESVEMNGEG